MKNPAADHPPKFWNIWWTLTVISALLTIIVLLLEGFGLFRDWGWVLSGIGIVITIVGSAQASTRTSVLLVNRELRAIHDTLSHSLKVQNQIRDALERSR
jgi:hypothetical protein